MKLDFTREEARAFLEVMRAESGLVRLVNPATQTVYGPAGAPEEHVSCCNLWGRCERCENCTSLRALKTQGCAYKMELCNHHTFWVVSRYLRIEGTPYVAEIVTDVTDNLMMDSNQQDEVGRLIQNYNHQLVTDALTGTYNRRFLDESFLPSLACCREAGICVSVAMMDFDDFKRVNDDYGHLAGDALLRDAAGFWLRHFNSRKKGKERMVVRYGGDELLLIACGLRSRAFDTQIREYYGQMRKICYYTDEVQIPFTITFGLASSEELGDAWTWEALLELADKRMYTAKKEHR